MPQYQTMLARPRPRDAIGCTGRRLAADQLADLVRLDTRLKALKAELKQAVLATGSHLMDLHGLGPAGATRILADVGDVRRFPDRNHFASWTGTAPYDASSGAQIRHRLSRAGNRRMNHVLYITAAPPPSCNCGTTPPAGPTTGASSPPAKPPRRRCAA